jgi:Ceramidase
MAESSSDFLRGRWGWLALWGSFLILCVIVTLTYHFGHIKPWSDVTADRIAWYHHEECENVDTSGVFLQVHNFWSNFAYLAAGMMIVCLNDSSIGRAVGVVLIFLAFGSAWFHGTLTEAGQTVDVAGVYAALLAMCAYGFIEMVPLEYDSITSWLIFSLAVVLGVVAGIIRTKVSFFSSDYFTPFLVFILVVYMISGALRYQRDRSPLLWPGLAAGVAGLLAVIFKFTDGDDNFLLAQHGGDYEKCFYGHGSLFQGHAWWHLLSAVMFLCVFEFVRSLLERSRTVWPWRLE